MSLSADRAAEAVNRLDLRATDDSFSLGKLDQEEEEVAESAGRGAVEGGTEATKEKIGLGGRRGKEED